AYGDTSAAAVQKVADLAFKTVELGQTKFPELAQSMGAVTSLSKELGVSQEELFATYATLTGVTGNASEVQTQLKGVLNGLIKPSEKMTSAIHSLGYETGYSMVKSLGFAGTLDALQKATGNSSEKVLELFNNNRAISGILPLVGELYDSYTQKLGKLENASGAATKAFEVQTEGVAKTGFTLEQAKVKMQVAAQRFGESAAPIIADFAGVVDKASDALANMSDEQRKNIINGAVLTTKIGVGLAVGGKLVTLGTKVVGVAKAIAPALAAVGPAGWITAGGIAAISAAVVVGKAAYDNWYDSQYRWTKGLSEGNEKVKESLDKYKNLSSIQKEVNDLQWVIKNPESSTADVENAKSRLEEIKSLLSEEYNLVINSDNSNLDETLEKVKQISAKELQSKINSQNVRLGELQNKNQNYEADRKEAEKNYNQALDFQTKASDAKLRLEDIYRQVKDGTLEQAQAYKQAKEIYKDTMGYEYRAINEGADNLTGLLYSTNGISQAFVDASNKVKYYSDAIENLDGSHAEMVAVGTELANWQTELVGLNAAAHDNAGVMNNLHSMGDTIRKAGLDMSGYAQAASLAMNGLTDFNGAVEKFANGDGADLSAVIRDYSTAMDAFGATAEQKQAGLQAFADKLTEIGHATNTLPADKHIEITADGNAVVVAGEAKQSVEEVPEEHNTEIKAEDNTAAGVQSAKSNLSTIPRNIPVTISVHQTIGDGSSLFNKLPNAWSREATGTDYFPGGLAMVNDQRGVADPRELIVDRGRAFIPEGRDVILSLSKGAKVYTAAQTKAIMEGAGIPHYAEGKNNSDAFTKARDDWQHYTKTHAVATAEELQKWLEFQEKYKKNEKDIWDIEEQVFSLRQKQYSEQTKASEQWLAHETKYNGLAFNEQLDAIDRIRKNTVAAYEAG
ncbi:MAG: phage tail tape measure protein, partial [Clostridia bacterium]|nr:phage tail tape measure protein [Clostridia bacterium]